MCNNFFYDVGTNLTHNQNYFCANFEKWLLGGFIFMVNKHSYHWPLDM